MIFFSCAPHLTDLLKLRVAGESGQDGKEDTTVIQEMITTLQVISFFLFFKYHALISPQSVKVGGQGMERRACMTQLIRMARCAFKNNSF